MIGYNGSQINVALVWFRVAPPTKRLSRGKAKRYQGFAISIGMDLGPVKRGN